MPFLAGMFGTFDIDDSDREQTLNALRGKGGERITPWLGVFTGGGNLVAESFRKCNRRERWTMKGMS